MVCEGKEAVPMEKTHAAIYCRLSQDDGSLGDSGSIQTQKALLTQYCQEHHMEIVDCYCDDGWSGTNFNRPAFQRMIGEETKAQILEREGQGQHSDCQRPLPVWPGVRSDGSLH